MKVEVASKYRSLELRYLNYVMTKTV